MDRPDLAVDLGGMAFDVLVDLVEIEVDAQAHVAVEARLNTEASAKVVMVLFCSLNKLSFWIPRRCGAAHTMIKISQERPRETHVEAIVFGRGRSGKVLAGSGYRG